MRRQFAQVRQLALLFLVAELLLSGCATTQDERVAYYKNDGVVLFARGDYLGARDSFELALTFAPQDAGLLYNMGQCADRMGDAKRAEQYYVQSLTISSKQQGQTRRAYAALLYRTGRAPEANRMIADWLEQEPKLADAYALDAWRLRQEKAIPQAESRLQQALSFDAHNALALTELGIVYEAMGMPDRALVLYERVLADDPKQSDIAERVSEMRAKGIKAPQPDA